MKVFKKVTVMGGWAKPGEDYKDGGKVTIKDSGSEVQGQYGSQNVFKIETLNGEKNLAFNQSTINNLVDAFGDETENWVNKVVNVSIIKALIAGELKTVTYLFADGWTMDNKGHFHGPSSVDTNNEDVVDLNSEFQEI